jgi:hypothetical protein
LRWRNRQGTDAVTTGLLSGSIPLAAGLVLSHFDFHCGSAGSASLCTAFAALVGIGAGALIAVREARQRDHFWSWVTAGAIATLAASLGCLRLGLLGLVGVMVGMAVGTTATIFARR